MTLMEAPRDQSLVPLLLGESMVMQVLRARIAAAARVGRTTLITGPTGSGKDLVARTLHARSNRALRPFVCVHCAALPESLIESELFGHSRGAFTGAIQTRNGLAKTAARGTLFLDEIDTLPVSAQAKLLRFLETGEYRPVGSDRVEHAETWVIAASNQDLVARAREGSFRADLLFRLAVIKIDVPPLRDRIDDILDLAEIFLGTISGGTKQLGDDARRALHSHDWPGNVRELKHRVEAAALLSDEAVLDAASLLLPLGCSSRSARRHEADSPDPTAVTAPPGSATEPLSSELWRLVDETGLGLSSALALCEQLLVKRALVVEGNNRARAAGRLQINVRTIFKKLASALTPPAAGRPSGHGPDRMGMPAET